MCVSRVCTHIHRHLSLHRRPLGNYALPSQMHPIYCSGASLLHTCVERGGAVRSALGSSVIWITSSTTPSTPFSCTLPLTIYKGM